VAEGDKQRVDSIDLLRGLAMIVMALDHVRDFLSGAHFDPTDVTKTTLGYYLTRFVTHFCAPTFVFLAGTSAYLQLARGKPKPVLARFLLTRGLWLVFLELTFVRFGWALNVDYHFVGVQVIWALGWSMVVLAPLVYLPPRVTAAIGLAVIVLHNLTDQVHATSWLWTVLHEGGVISLPAHHRVFVVYPLLPWAFVMAAGFGFGELVDVPPAKRRRRVLLVGAALALVFVALRASNVYGDPHPWAHHPSFGQTLGDFMNCEKYPPSLSFLLMTLGPSIALLSPLERFRGVFADVLRTFGRVPLFYYLLHVVFIHVLAVLLATVRYGHVQSGMFALPFNWHVPSDYGYSLPIVYALWLFVVAALYPLCRWFEGVKRRTKSVWLSYL
jgi:uncharacterized membrane protein